MHDSNKLISYRHFTNKCTSCQMGTVLQWVRPGHSTRRCWFPQTDRAGLSWPTRCSQKTGRNSWRRRSRWSQLQESRKLVNIHSMLLKRHISETFSTHPASSDVRFCPWAERTRCSQEGQPACRGNWRSRSCRRCSRRWRPAGSPLCYAGRCCWWGGCWSACTWTDLKRRKEPY